MTNAPQWVLPLAGLNASKLPAVGAKAVNLGQLIGCGLPVPEGFVITTRAYRLALQALPRPDTVTEHDARRAIQHLSTAPLPHELEVAVTEACATHLGDFDAIWTVRSSATVEDSAASSFAGQFESCYDVGPGSLLDTVRRCWASVWSVPALTYIQRVGVPVHNVDMAVIVQRQIEARASGVLFSVHPVSADANTMMVESVWGKGAVLADGRADPDRFVMDKQHLRLKSRHVGTKQLQVSANGLARVAAETAAKVSLSSDGIRTLGALAMRAERHFGVPQDIEWAQYQDRFYLLQSRPITGTPATVASEVTGTYVVFKPALENFTAPLTPLTADLLASAPFPGARIIKGWFYWEAGWLRWLLPLRLSDRECMELFSLRADPGRRYRVAWWKLPLLAALLVAGYAVLGVFLARTRNLPAGFMAGFRQRIEQLEQDPSVSALDVVQQVFLPRHPLEPVGMQVLLVNISAARHLLFMAALDACLRRWLPASSTTLLSALGSGGTGVLSATMGEDLMALAEQARRCPAAANIITREPAGTAMDALRHCPQAAGFVTAVDEFLAVYGHRATRELELAAPRFAEDPIAIIAMLQAALRSGTASHSTRVQNTNPVNTLHPLKRRLIGYLSRRARYFNRLRENSRFYHIMAFGLVRRKILHRADKLFRSGRLSNVDDVFFLQIEELDELEHNRLQPADAAQRIAARRRRHTRLVRTGPPMSFGLAVTPSEPESGEYLNGTGASPGVYEGPARVILDPLNAGALQAGEILVAPYTDPAWTPLFMVAGAAMVEVGSYLSHAGAVAREYAMPCVVDVAGATARITNGELLRVDGDSGKVWRLRQEGD